MESATLTERNLGTRLAARVRPTDADGLARAVFALLCIGFAVGFLVYPTYPNYDSYYSLLWGREVLDLQAPTFEGFRVPTEHPLAIAAGAVLALLGDGGDRVWVGMTFASYLALVWGIYRLGRDAFTPLVGAIAAVLLLTRFDFAFLAARGYVDVPYMALIVWAAVLEGARTRRGTPVFVLLAAAGLLRPEAWLLAGLYFLWMAWRPGRSPAVQGRPEAGQSSQDAGLDAPRRNNVWPERVRYAALTAIGPIVWAGVDFAVTGDPLFSLHYTSSSAEDLGRQRTLSELPSAVPYFFSNLVKLPVWLASIGGIVIAALVSPRRMLMPLVLLISGLGTFVAIGVAGLSVIERYLIVAALALLVFAAVALGGFTMLRKSRLRTLWMAGVVLLVIYGVAFTVTRANLRRFDNELRFRGDAHAALEHVLRDPRVKAGLRCGPLTVPNHKLVPDARWIADLPADRVLARADEPAVRGVRSGVALVVTSRFAIFKHAYTDENDAAAIQLPPPGFTRVATSDHYAAYVSCR